jgi:hypothetical protein
MLVVPKSIKQYVSSNQLLLIILSVGGDVPFNSETLFTIDFMNLKIKPAQSFRDAHNGNICACVHRSEYSYVYEYPCFYCVSKKRILILIIS